MDRLENFGIYKVARQLFDDFWNDSEILAKDYRGKELARQQVRSLDSICANIEEGFGRGFGKELPQHLKIARGEARESKGRYERCKFLLPAQLIKERSAALTILWAASRKQFIRLKKDDAKMGSSTLVTRLPSLVTLCKLHRC